MGLALGIIVLVLTALAIVLIIGANGMSDAPSQDGISPLPLAIGGVVIGLLLIGSHYMHVSW